MAYRQVNSDAIAAELRDSAAAHRKIQILPVKNLRSQFEGEKVGSQPNDKGIQLKKDPKPFLEWLGELDQHHNSHNIVKYYESEQQLRMRQNLVMEGFSVWYSKHILAMFKLKKDLESEEANLKVPPSSPLKKQQKEHAWIQQSAEFDRSQSQKKRQ